MTAYEAKRYADGAVRYLLPASAEWITLSEAAKIIDSAEHTLHCNVSLVSQCIRRRSRGDKGGRGVGWLWSREDCERLANIKRECRLRTAEALRVLAALKEWRIA